MKDELELLDEQESVKRDYVAILIRRRWYLIAPLLICGLLGAVVAQVWPLLYKSEALILVEQQKVPEQYVMPNVITNLQTRLDAMTQQILSRTRLVSLIEQFNLYPRERARLPMDDVVDRMHKNIDVSLVQTAGRQGDVTGFRITYLADNPRVAQRITNELTSMFIDESIRERTQQSTDTTEFLTSQLNDAQNDLAAQEAKLREYKMKFLGELPEQQTSNLQILSSLQAQLYAAEEALQRAEQQRTYLSAMREQYEALTTPQVTADGSILLPGTVQKPPALVQAEGTLLDLQKQLQQAQAMFGDRYPDVIQLKGQIADWKQTIQQLEAESTAKGSAAPKKDKTPAPAAGSPATRLSLAEIESRLKALEIETASDRKDVADIEARIKDVQARLSMTPVREQQLAEITRTYENSREQYQSLLQKKLQSELASNLDKRQQGEQFRILDPASLPQKAEGRLQILGAGWVLGLCLGIGLAILREFAQARVHDENDLSAIDATIPVFEVPVIRTASETRRRRLRLALEASGAMILIAAAAAASARTYFLS